MRGKPAEKLRPGTAQSVAEVLRDHVVLELEGIDRMYLNVYVPVLQAVEPRLSLQIRPYIITSKPANGSDPEQHLVIACQRPSWQRPSF